MTPTDFRGLEMRDPDWVSECGNYRLWNGNSVEIVDDEHVFDSVVTDPPYGMDFKKGRKTGLEHDKNTQKKISGDKDVELINWACSLNATYSKYVFCRWQNLASFELEPKSFIAWVKYNGTGSGDLRHGHENRYESIAFYPGVNHEWGIKRPQDVVLTEYRPDTLNAKKKHPTPKPIGIMTEVCSWCKGSIFDPFMGIGSTGVACVRLGIPFWGIELDETWFGFCVEHISQEIEKAKFLEPQTTQKSLLN